MSFYIRGQVKSMINLDDRKTRCLSLDNICVVIGGSQWGGCFYGLRLSVYQARLQSSVKVSDCN